MIGYIKGRVRLRIKMTESLFLISSASSQLHVENKRASFTNELPKTFSSNTGRMCIAVENIAFDNIFTSYESDSGVPDLILTHNKRAFKPSLGRCDTLQELCEKINECFIHFKIKNKLDSNTCTIHFEKNRVQIGLHFGLVKFSTKLFTFLNISEFVRRVKVGEQTYYVLREEAEPPTIICRSSSQVNINERRFDFVDIVCESIESYPSVNDSFCKILCSVPVSHNQVTTYFQSPTPHFHKVESTYLRSLKIEFRQQNGEKIYFGKGSPNLIKLNLKMLNTKKDFFYVTVSSKQTDNFPENSPSRFEAELPKEYTLTGDWVVCVTNAYIPPPQNFLKPNTEVYEIEEGDAYCCVWPTEPNARKKCSKLDLLRFTRRELCIFFAVNFSDFLDVYLNEKEEIFLTPKKGNTPHYPLQFFTSSKLMSILNSHNFFHVQSPSKKDLEWYEGFKEVTNFIKMDRMNHTGVVGGLIDLPFSALPENSFYFEMNIFYNISDISLAILTQIDEIRRSNILNLDFIQKEEQRLAEWYQQNRLESGGELLPSFFFIYCDFVKETSMGDRFANIVKTIPYKNGVRSLPGGFYSFQTNEYYNVSKNCLRTFDFAVKTQSGESYKYFTENENIRLTLKFQKL